LGFRQGKYLLGFNDREAVRRISAKRHGTAQPQTSLVESATLRRRTVRVRLRGDQIAHSRRVEVEQACSKASVGGDEMGRGISKRCFVLAQKQREVGASSTKEKNEYPGVLN
jgi:hypothetical protein